MKLINVKNKLTGYGICIVSYFYNYEIM